MDGTVCTILNKTTRGVLSEFAWEQALLVVVGGEKGNLQERRNSTLF